MKKTGHKSFSDKQTEPWEEVSFQQLEFRPEWQLKENRVLFKCGLIPGKILFISIWGELDSKSAGKIPAIFKKIFSSGLLSNSRYIYIVDYSGVKHSTIHARKQLMTVFYRLNRAYNAVPVMSFVSGASPNLKTALFFIKNIIKQNFIFTKSVDDIFRRINAKDFSPGETEKPGEISILQKDLEDLAGYIAGFYLDKDKKIGEPIPSNSQLHSILEAFRFMQLDIDSLIAAQEKQKRKLENTKQNFRTFLDFLDNFLVVADIAEKKILYVNQAVPRKLGYSKEELYGRQVFILSSQLAKRKINRAINKMHRGHGKIHHLKILTKDHREIPMALDIRKGKWNGRVALFFVMKNISKQLAYEKKLWDILDHSKILNCELSEKNKEIERRQKIVLSMMEDADITRQKLTLELMKKEASLAKAHQLHKNLVQRRMDIFNNYNILPFFMPCEELGGDVFIIKKGLTKNKFVIVLGDCTGHGVKASMDASLLKSIADTQLYNLYKGNRTDLYLKAINLEYMKHNNEDEFPTLFACLIDMDKNIMYYSNANGEIPYIIKNGRVTKLEKPAGFHLGYSSEIVFEQKEIGLQPGDILFFYSDAIVEIETSINEQLGYKGVEKIIGNFGKGVKHDLDYILHELGKVSGGFPLQDDTTLIIVEHLRMIKKKYTARVTGDLKAVKAALCELLHYYNYTEDETAQIAIALEEMLTNGIVHGNKNDPSKKVIIICCLDCEKIILTVEDEGEGFSPGEVPDPAAMLIKLQQEGCTEKLMHGRGTWLINQYMDEVIYSERGNRVTAKKFRGAVNTVMSYEDEISEKRKKKVIYETGEQNVSLLKDTEGSHIIHWSESINIKETLENSSAMIRIFFSDHYFLNSKTIGKMQKLIIGAFQKEKKIKFYVNQELGELFEKLNFSKTENIMLEII